MNTDEWVEQMRRRKKEKEEKGHDTHTDAPDLTGTLHRNEKQMFCRAAIGPKRKTWDKFRKLEI